MYQKLVDFPKIKIFYQITSVGVSYSYISWHCDTDITNSPLLFNFEIFVAFFVVALVERATRKM